MLGLTPNDEVNSLFAREARDDFDVPATFAAINTLSKGMTPALLRKQGSHMLFDGPTDVERWNVRFRHGIARFDRFHWVGAPESAAEPGEADAERARGVNEADPFVILMLRRSGRWDLMHADLTPRMGDVAVIAIHEAEVNEAYTELARLGWAPGEEAEAEAEAAAADEAETIAESAG
ncbi:MAG: hypothetical protein HKP30_05635 [Myxococcales bacterium]|nr:hypothetical protein [Myxococcales bacterium]